MALARGQSQLCRVGGLQLRKKILQCTGLKIRCQSSGYIQELESEGRDSKGRKGKEDKGERYREGVPNLVCKLCPNLWLTSKSPMHEEGSSNSAKAKRTARIAVALMAGGGGWGGSLQFEFSKVHFLFTKIISIFQRNLTESRDALMYYPQYLGYNPDFSYNMKR